MTFRTFAAAAATAVAIAALALATPQPVAAQSAGPEATQTLDEAEIKAFAAAVVGVKRIADSYMPILAEKQTKAEQNRVEGAALAEMKQVVESEGLSISRFNQILSLASVSPDLTDRIRSHLPQ